MQDYVSDEVYLEAGVQNITSGPLCLEKVDLEPSPYFNVTPMNHLPENTKSLVFGQMNVVNPHDTRQYLYCLKPKPEAKNNPSALRQATAIGKLDIVWRTNMGDRGRLQTSQLQRMAPQYGDVRVTVEKIPSMVCLEEQFDVGLSITNICERVLELNLDFLNGGGGSEWSGVSSRSLPPLQPGESTQLTLHIVPLQTGLQTIAGVRLTDTFLKRTYKYENLAQVFVNNEKSEEKQAFFSSWMNYGA
ncbi:trafficking protein particle complex subunit 13-like [Macrobrachium nipponense]|uniref:trafficking protein particle complex subunit 13-like n=1 Tax=Macrobrachium nipponense TaxID=159736 RepID=UPI0030C7D9A2